MNNWLTEFQLFKVDCYQIDNAVKLMCLCSRAVKRVCVCVCVISFYIKITVLSSVFSHTHI